MYRWRSTFIRSGACSAATKEKRGAENRRYLAWKGKITTNTKQARTRFKNRKQYKYFRCPNCKACQTAARRGRGDRYVRQARRDSAKAAQAAAEAAKRAAAQSEAKYQEAFRSPAARVQGGAGRDGESLPDPRGLLTMRLLALLTILLLTGCATKAAKPIRRRRPS